MEVLTFDEFSAKRGCPSTAPSRPEMHRYPRRPPGSQQRAMDRIVLAEGDAWVRRREALRQEYDAKVAAGEIRPPGRRERLEKAATGHPDNPSTQAALRLLAAMDAK